MSNSLTRRVSLTFGPLFLETLVKHYFARVVSDGSKAPVPLRRDALLYDEAFNIVKDFLDVATRHTVEELQSFSNVRTPSPPWVHVVRLVIPTFSCDEAAVYLIKAFGGEDVMKRVVGGTKWWQVRGIRGLDAEWISAKKDWQNAQRLAKERRASLATSQEAEPPAPRDPILTHVASNNKETSSDSAAYQPEMDEMRCILYAHGGGYYFGSVDQERYSIQRYARKIHGRVLAVNYRLAPQYPFPCAIQDLLAASIVIAGDSAGGGLLPAPAGGVLISPWCDLTHSFPSILTNTDTVSSPSFRCDTSHWPFSAQTQPPLAPAFERRQLQGTQRAHRAAHPEKFPLRDETKEMYPLSSTLRNTCNRRQCIFKFTMVYPHRDSAGLLIPDFPSLDIGHVLPVLFPFTTPGKYCYRAMALFIKHVTNAKPVPSTPADPNFSTFPAPLTPQNENPTLQVPPPRMHRSLSLKVQHAASSIKRRSSLWSRPSAQGNSEPARISGDNSRLTSGQVTPRSQDPSDISIDVAGPRIGGSSEPHADDVPRPGEAWVYAGEWVKPIRRTSETTSHILSQARSATHQDMIRERVSIQGIIRPLEPEPELPAMQMSPELVGTLSEHALRRYITGHARFTKKFARAIRHIEKQRMRNIDRATRDTDQHIAALQHYLDREQTGTPDANWTLAWALDADERPPPSSIVARRDTAEALKLARVADKAVLASERALSANNLWSVVVGFLTASPDEHPKARDDRTAKTHIAGARSGRTARLGSFFRRKRRTGSAMAALGVRWTRARHRCLKRRSYRGCMALEMPWDILCT
ncbi:hypothetical protein EI94DRAFT_1728993 [Lactarius quietus]|nr:hypothetical protein EI94DRAFT_1728993 [Lactarius quietus]